MFNLTKMSFSSKMYIWSVSIFMRAISRLFRNISPYLWVAIAFATASVFLMLTLKGLTGNPTVNELVSPQWQVSGPFDTSSDKGRYSLLYSVVENKQSSFSLPLARFAAPDLAINPSGEYVSLFMPGVSFIGIPGYLIGKYFGFSQVGTFATNTVFAFVNLLLIYSIARKLGASTAASFAGAIMFLFATPAFAYSTTFYQHHISVAFILLAIRLLLFGRNWMTLSLIWVLCGLSVIVDNPNLFMMFPIGLYALSGILSIEKNGEKFSLDFYPWRMLTFVFFIPAIVLLILYNQAANGSPFRLSGMLPRVLAIDETGKPTASDIDKILQTASSRQELIEANNSERRKDDALGFFRTRNLLNGFYTHTISPDRGVLHYALPVLLGLFGLAVLLKSHKGMANLFLAIIAVNVLLYSMWGDPWGGWAFGSRYLIPAYAILGIGVAILISNLRKNFLLLILVTLLFVNSVQVNTLGALTSVANPPRNEVLLLEKITGKEQKYTYERNRQYLSEQGTKSFVYNTWLKENLSVLTYYQLLWQAISIFGGVIILIAFREAWMVSGRALLSRLRLKR